MLGRQQADESYLPQAPVVVAQEQSEALTAQVAAPDLLNHEDGGSEAAHAFADEEASRICCDQQPCRLLLRPRLCCLSA